MKLERLAAAGSLLAVVACGGTSIKQHAIGNRIVPVDSTPVEVTAAAPAPAPAPAVSTPTILARPIALSNERGVRTQVRRGEHDAAPYIDRPGGPREAGHIIASSEVPGVEVIEARSPYVIDEVLYVKMPDGVTATPGMRLAVESLGPEFDGYGQVLIPTGEVTVVAPGGPGEATSVRLERQFAEVEPNQLIVQVDVPKYPAVGQRAVAVSDGMKAKVIWVSGNPVEPSLGFFVVLDAAEKDGVHVGDQFTLVRPRMRDELTGLWLPEQDIATAQVVRVGAHSSTGVVIAQTMPAISAGAAARLTAKMP